MKLFRVFLPFFEVSDVEGGDLIAWSDSCAGQNKNFFVLCLRQYLTKTAKFKSIEHKFPIEEHSFLDSDRDFAFIERQVRKGECIYTPSQYKDWICKAKKRPNSFHIFDKEGAMLDATQLRRTLGLFRRKKTWRVLLFR